ncbi:hypothetical protein LTR36_004400 [Oleoguttula mirabilis]|uniref:Uncharacterized protein n=1 Tax=Oleoguttula mirabilis TaxID=1507867 RepID=A0AAV9JGJ6_9PEZI|nr:hypothetical protein LTR36_004400 [Oleoguttula mirabilis]
MAPSYYYTLAAMVPHPHAPYRVSTGGRWLPPKARGWNRKSNTVVFYYDGQASRMVPQVPAQSQLYKCYSIYHDRAVIWMVDFDASLHHVGDGDDGTAAAGDGTNESDDEDDSDSEVEEREQTPDQPNDNPDWKTLMFGSMANYALYAGQRLEHQRLPWARPDQLWATQLLPDTYRAQLQTANARYGGMNGELPLLLGIVALSMPAQALTMCLPNCIVNPWRLYPDAQIPRGSGWADRRGLVVTVYTDPQRSTAQDLRNYELGVGGNILP